MKFAHSLVLWLAAVALGLAGCQKSPESQLVGVWKQTGSLGGDIISFRSDGSVAITSTGGAPDVYGTWKMLDGRIAIHPRQTEQTIDLQVISLGKAELDVRGGSGTTVMSFQRIADQPPPPSKAELYAATPEAQRRAAQERETVELASSVDLKVLRNARDLSYAADQYYLENGVSTVQRSALVGETNYMKALKLAAHESYPDNFTQGETITVSGIAGARTVTYAP